MRPTKAKWLGAFGAATIAAAVGCGGGDDTSASTQGSGAASSSAGPGGGGAGGSPTGSGGGTAGGGAGGSCNRMPAPADATRVVVVSHPYDTDGNPSASYEVLELASDGTLTRTNRTFSLGVSTGGKMAFTPDGEVGIVPDTEGDLGVVRFDAARMPTVVHAKFHGSFYAGVVAVEPGGDSALVLDPDWRNNGGGIYRVRIGCDGSLTDEGLVAPAKLSAGLAWVAGGSRAVLAATDVLGSAAGDDAHLLRFDPAPAVLGGADAFGDDEAIVVGFAVTHDEKFALLGDDNQFGSVPNRVAVVGVGASALTAVDVLPSINDPVDIATSPFDDAALVVSGFDNAIYALDYHPASLSAPFSLRGEITYQGAPPQLPFVAVQLTRGPLEGLVIVTENVGLRPVRFEAGGAITDLGIFSFGSGLESITGSLGIAP